MIKEVKNIEGSSEVFEGTIRKIPILCSKCMSVGVYSNDTLAVFIKDNYYPTYVYTPVICSKCILENVCD